MYAHTQRTHIYIYIYIYNETVNLYIKEVKERVEGLERGMCALDAQMDRLDVLANQVQVSEDEVTLYTHTHII
jgi:hypothetical protein